MATIARVTISVSIAVSFRVEAKPTGDFAHACVEIEAAKVGGTTTAFTRFAILQALELLQIHLSPL